MRKYCKLLTIDYRGWFMSIADFDSWGKKVSAQFKKVHFVFEASYCYCFTKFLSKVRFLAIDRDWRPFDGAIILSLDISSNGLKTWECFGKAEVMISYFELLNEIFQGPMVILHLRSTIKQMSVWYDICKRMANSLKNQRLDLWFLKKLYTTQYACINFGGILQKYFCWNFTCYTCLFI